MKDIGFKQDIEELFLSIDFWETKLEYNQNIMHMIFKNIHYYFEKFIMRDIIRISFERLQELSNTYGNQDTKERSEDDDAFEEMILRLA